jgi:hypothetical protein
MLSSLHPLGRGPPPGVPSRDSNSGLPYSKPMRYFVKVMLREMKAMDTRDELTPLGRILAKLPIDPRLGKMMVLGALFYAGDALTTMAAASATGSEIFMTDMTRGR